MSISTDHRRWGFAFFLSVVRNDEEKRRALVCLSSSQLHFSVLPMVHWVEDEASFLFLFHWWAGGELATFRRETEGKLLNVKVLPWSVHELEIFTCGTAPSCLQAKDTNVKINSIFCSELLFSLSQIKMAFLYQAHIIKLWKHDQ